MKDPAYDELLNETLFSALGQARATLGRWLSDYNGSRPHSALGWQTPSAFAAPSIRHEIAEALRVTRPVRDGGFLAIDAALHFQRPFLGILAAQERLVDVLPLPTDQGSPEAGS